VSVSSTHTCLNVGISYCRKSRRPEHAPILPLPHNYFTRINISDLEHYMKENLSEAISSSKSTEHI
jgi:hypothetical protein